MRGKDGRARNKALVFSPAGELLVFYAKMQPFTPGGEAEHYMAGEQPVTFGWEHAVVSPFVFDRGEEFEVFETVVRLVFVLVMDVVSARDWAVGGFPHEVVFESFLFASPVANETAEVPVVEMRAI